MKVHGLVYTFLLFFFFLFLLPSPSLAATATSNCVVLNIGNVANPSLPPECQTGSGGPIAQRAIQYARDQIPRSVYVFGTPTRNWAITGRPGPSAPKTYDCSGLVGWAYYWASDGKISMGGYTHNDWKNLPQTGKYQRFLKTQGVKPQPGDIVYFAGSTGTVNPPDPGHVGIFAGPGQGTCSGKNDCFVHIFSTGRPPAEQSLSTKSDYVGFLRPVLQ